MSGGLVDQFSARGRQFRERDEERLEWMKAFESELQLLVDKHRELERQLQFRSEYYSGLEGGRKAAVDLRVAVQSHLREKDPALAEFPVVIKAIANGDGLPGALQKLSLQPSAATEFAKGFSNTFGTSDFVFVSRGKDRVDEKIRVVFNQFITNPTCRHIIVGVCHDNNYTRLLDNYRDDGDIVKKVTLLQSYKVGNELLALPFGTTRFPGIFRDGPLSQNNQNSPPPPSTGPAAAPTVVVNGQSPVTWASRAQLMSQATQQLLNVLANVWTSDCLNQVSKQWPPLTK
ncbi:hypothetical protein SAPIO_CDS6877 [Scedosporium apiospermum]|uniref:DUF7923 domain-containing protein n=1 Tax=Pseudallescheria apiosperma TaxID=563466 RepID=A0A084G2Y9_PSEDA|nr:uncharacterized protein SAPIO_CDS6877 [Scedosporium apiospermum]KEZ41701.1 hypothetical protein SAPIO_CDS6877 [Scedosporium apiospermum]